MGKSCETERLQNKAQITDKLERQHKSTFNLAMVLELIDTSSKEQQDYDIIIWYYCILETGNKSNENM